jgi:hypothetical protein
MAVHWAYRYDIEGDLRESRPLGAAQFFRRSSSGSLAKFTAIRRASSRVSRWVAERRLGKLQVMH